MCLHIICCNSTHGWVVREEGGFLGGDSVYCVRQCVCSRRKVRAAVVMAAAVAAAANPGYYCTGYHCTGYYCTGYSAVGSAYCANSAHDDRQPLV